MHLRTDHTVQAAQLLTFESEILQNSWGTYLPQTNREIVIPFNLYANYAELSGHN